MGHLTLIGQRVMDVKPSQPFTVFVSNIGNKPVYLAKQTALGTSLPSPAHIVTVGVVSGGMAEAREKGENGIEETLITDNAKTWEKEICVALDDHTIRPAVLPLLEGIQVTWVTVPENPALLNTESN